MRKKRRPPMNLWQCPKCKKLVDYADSEPSKGRTLCEAKGKRVQMVLVTDFETKMKFYRENYG